MNAKIVIVIDKGYGTILIEVLIISLIRNLSVGMSHKVSLIDVINDHLVIMVVVYSVLNTIFQDLYSIATKSVDVTDVENMKISLYFDF